MEIFTPHVIQHITDIFPQSDPVRNSPILSNVFSWFIVKSVECLRYLNPFCSPFLCWKKTWSKSMEKSQNSVGSIPSGFARPGQYLEHREMDRMTSTVRVFARAKPEDKLEAWSGEDWRFFLR